MPTEVSSEAVQTIRAVGEIIKDIKWPVLLGFLLYVARDGVTALIRRIINLDFRFGDASGTLKAGPTLPEQSVQPTIIETEMTKQLPPPTEDAEMVKGENKNTWFGDMYRAYQSGKIEEGRKIFQEHHDGITDTKERARFRAIYLHLDYLRGGVAESLTRHEELLRETTDPGLKDEIALWLSWSYTATRNYSSEARLWQGMLDAARDPLVRSRYISNLATSTAAGGHRMEAVTLIEQHLQAIPEEACRSILFAALARIESDGGDPLLAAVAYEKAAQYRPNDIEALFSAAFAESGVYLGNLAYLNYDTILSVRSDQDVAINNMGVEAKQLGMAGRSVGHYKHAEVQGNTLAMANLAYLYIGAGLFEEAGDILKRALAQQDPHPNVAAAHAELEKRKKDEEDLHRKSIEAGKWQSEFVRRYGDARFSFSTPVQNFAGQWFTESSIALDVCTNGQTIRSIWEESAGAIMVAKTQCIVEATVIGRSIRGTYERKPIQTGLLFGSGAEKRQIIGYLSDDGALLDIMAHDKSILKRITLAREPQKTN